MQLRATAHRPCCWCLMEIGWEHSAPLMSPVHWPHQQKIAELAGFSVGVVFAMQEIESWFIADAETLIGSGTAHAGRRGKKILFPEGDLEKSPRDAKRWLSENMPGGYKPTIDQSEFARLLNIQKVRSHNLRSFRRFEHAVTDLFYAAISGPHIASP